MTLPSWQFSPSRPSDLSDLFRKDDPQCHTGNSLSGALISLCMLSPFAPHLAARCHPEFRHPSRLPHQAINLGQRDWVVFIFSTGQFFIKLLNLLLRQCPRRRRHNHFGCVTCRLRRPRCLCDRDCAALSNLLAQLRSALGGKRKRPPSWATNEHTIVHEFCEML